MKAGSQKSGERCGRQRRTAGEDVPSLTTRLRSFRIVAEEEKEKQIIRARGPFSTDQLGGLPLRTSRFLGVLCGKGLTSPASFKNLKPQRSLRKAAKVAKSAE